MLRFQHLIDSQTKFKVDSRLLTEEEITYLVSYLQGQTVHLRYLFAYFGYEQRTMHTDSDAYFESEDPEYLLFVPPTEPALSNKQIFTMFLKKHRMYSAYKRNIATLAFPPGSSADVVGFLSGAFSWTQSPEGIPKWAHLDNAWLALVEDLKLTTRS